MNKQGIDTTFNPNDRPWGKEKLFEAGRILAIAAQFSLLIYTIKAFGIQSQAFHEVAFLVLFGFLIHAFLPLRFRLPFFTLLSIASIFVLLGFENGSWLIGLGMTLIGICHLPVPLMIRICILLAVGGLLALLRLDYGYSTSLQSLLGPFSKSSDAKLPWSVAIWPIFGSMFMFRLIIYLYDLHHAKKRPGLWETLSYFFMIPNICFPLFPVVDYKKMYRSYYNEEAWRIYQRGVTWIFRGAYQLILYRFVYLYFTIDPIDVYGLKDVIRFSLASYLLYLQVSGQFHLIVGMLLLFGFNLSETHHYYYLASTFTDFWRRINIYWKDFMLKIFYYPIRYQLRKLGETQSLIIATLVVFICTWMLHMYQWFWIRGTLLLEWHDALFWSTLGVIVIFNSLYEVKYGRARPMGRQKRNLFDHTSTILNTIATFISMCLLWGMWSSDSLSQWVTMWKTTNDAWIAVVMLIPVLYLTAWCAGRIARKQPIVLNPPEGMAKLPSFGRLVIPTTLGILLVYSIGQPTVYDRFPTVASKAFHGVRVGLNNRDLAKQERGYYEDLIGVNRNNYALWEVYSQKPKNWNSVPGSKIITKDYLESKFVPNNEFTAAGAVIKINSWGLKDQEYETFPPPGAHRIAILGASHVLGTGVNNDKIFESLLEDRLNDELSDNTGIRYEIINFAHGGRSALHQVMVLDQMVLPVHPKTILYVAHPEDDIRVIEELSRQFKNGHEIPYPYLQSILKKAAVDRKMERFAIKKALKPFANELLKWSYERMVASCRKHEIVPVWVLLPMTWERPTTEEAKREIEMAKQAGFSIISLHEVYYGIDPVDLAITPWDNHPNEMGHQLIADQLYQSLLEKPNLVLEQSKNSEI